MSLALALERKSVGERMPLFIHIPTLIGATAFVNEKSRISVLQ